MNLKKKRFVYVFRFSWRNQACKTCQGNFRKVCLKFWQAVLNLAIK